jgi:hypothetical protein
VRVDVQSGQGERRRAYSDKGDGDRASKAIEAKGEIKAKGLEIKGQSKAHKILENN